MRPIVHFLTGTFLLCVSHGVAFQQAASPKAMLLGAEDQITIRISDFEDVPDRPLPIDSGGFLDLPVFGTGESSGTDRKPTGRAHCRTGSQIC